MNAEQALTLGRRAVACKGWRWMPGMRLLRRGEWRVDEDGCARGGPLVSRIDDDEPDLRDAATLGCLWQLVWDARGKAGATMRWSTGPTAFVEVETDEGCCRYEGASFASALVAALEAAP